MLALGKFRITLGDTYHNVKTINLELSLFHHRGEGHAVDDVGQNYFQVLYYFASIFNEMRLVCLVIWS